MNRIKAIQEIIHEQQNKLNHLRHPRKIRNFRQQLLVKWIASLTENEHDVYVNAGIMRLLYLQVQNKTPIDHFMLGATSRLDLSAKIDMTGLRNCTIDSDLDYVLYSTMEMTFEGVVYRLHAKVYKRIDAADEQLLRAIGVIKEHTNNQTYTSVSCDI